MAKYEITHLKGQKVLDTWIGKVEEPMQKEQAKDAEDGGYGKEGLEAKFGGGGRDQPRMGGRAGIVRP